MEPITDPDRFRNSSFQDQTLKFNQKGRMVIGGGFSAERCTVCIGPEVECLMSGAEFVKCTITSHTEELALAQYAVFYDCSFHGTLIDWKFGGRTGKPPLIACDFRDADLHDCEFYDTAVAEQTFRGWPTVVFLDPLKNKESMRRASWPRGAKAQIWVQSLWRAPFSGVAVDGVRAAMELGIQPEKLRQIIGALGALVIT